MYLYLLKKIKTQNKSKSINILIRKETLIYLRFYLQNLYILRKILVLYA